MSIDCTHSLAEKETACADGVCPICLLHELDLTRGIILKTFEDWGPNVALADLRARLIRAELLA